jgi:NAD+ kinase
MKKICIVEKEPGKTRELKSKLGELGFVYDEENPELVLAFGGDGTFLIAERIFPGIPKILIKGSEHSKKGVNLDIEEVLRKYTNGEFSVEKMPKLKVALKSMFGGGELIAINDIVIRNTLPTEAIRFKLNINGENLKGGGNFIGDGVVISTPYGSGAYFHSITRESFKEGIGIAFSNLTEHQDFILLNKKDEIEIEITRGPAVLVADNNRNFINLEEGDVVKIKEIGEFSSRILLG